MHRNWFMFPPHDTWRNSIVSLISCKAAHGGSYEEIIETVRHYGPLQGWDDESRRFATRAVKAARSASK